MTKYQKKLHKEVVEHWYQNLDILILNYLSGNNLFNYISIGSSSCPFCGVYNVYNISMYDDYDCDGCVGCPIYLITKERYCRATPHVKIEKLYKETNIYNPMLHYNKKLRKNMYYRLYRAISKEINFLLSLK